MEKATVTLSASTGILTVAELGKSTKIISRQRLYRTIIIVCLTQGEAFSLCLNALSDRNQLNSIMPISEQLLQS